MYIFDLLFGRKNPSKSISANIARERLQVIISHHKNNTLVYDDDIVTKIKQDILSLLSKYYPSADVSNINMQVEKNGHQSLLQIDLTIPEESAIVTKIPDPS